MGAQTSIRVWRANMLRYYSESSAHAGKAARSTPRGLTCEKW